MSRAAPSVAVAVATLALLGGCARKEVVTTPAPATTTVVSASVSQTTTATDPSAPIELRLDAARYQPGATVQLTIANHSGNTYSYNPCARTVERFVDNAWNEVMEDRMCTMTSVLLGPHETRSGSTSLPVSVGSGRYRLVMTMARQGVAPDSARTRAVSGGFDVAP